jgi:hypothetical protein
VKQSSCRTAGAAQYRGVQRIRFGLSEQLLALEARAKPKDDHLVPDTPSNTIPATLTAAERDAANRVIVEEELRRYEALIIPSHIAVNDGVDLLQFWDVRLLRQMRRLHGLTIPCFRSIVQSFLIYSVLLWMFWLRKPLRFRASASPRLLLARTFWTATEWRLLFSKPCRHSSTHTGPNVVSTWSVLSTT